MIGKGSTYTVITEEDARDLIAQVCDTLQVDHKRVLVIIPDGTRTAPIPLMFRLLYEQLGERVAQLDYLIALGTHQPMSEEGISHLVGATAQEREKRYPNVRIFNHTWSDPRALRSIGVISRAEAASLTDGLLVDEVPVTL